jgi:predicted outer membrane repeat protein
MVVYRLAAIATVLLLVTCVLHAEVIEVPGDYLTIREGVNAAVEGDTVLVAPGTYSGAQNRAISFFGENICLISEQGAGSTIIDCEQADRAFLFGSGETEASIVDGFTIVNGGGRPFNGGAIYIYEASPTIRNCVFLQNTADDAGAVLCLYSSSTISNCTFLDNTAELYSGGALACSYSSPTVTGCTFSGNAASGGSAIRMYDSSGSINDCTIVGNSTAEYGVIRFDVGSTTAITNTIFAFNTHGVPIMSLGGSVPTITHCVVFGNAEGDSLSGSYHDNLFVDPLLCDMYADDFSLCADSPCLPGSLENPWGEFVGAHDQGCAACGSAVEQTTWGVIKGMYR